MLVSLSLSDLQLISLQVLFIVFSFLSCFRLFVDRVPFLYFLYWRLLFFFFFFRFHPILYWQSLFSHRVSTSFSFFRKRNRRNRKETNREGRQTKCIQRKEFCTNRCCPDDKNKKMTVGLPEFRPLLLSSENVIYTWLTCLFLSSTVFTRGLGFSYRPKSALFSVASFPFFCFSCIRRCCLKRVAHEIRRRSCVITTHEASFLVL